MATSLTKNKLFWILLGAFLLRFIVAFLGEHGDVVNYYWWSRDLLQRGILGFYDREIVNAMRPTYPPVTSYLFLASAYLHELVWKISWFLNIYIQLFPSNLIFWLESPKGWFLFNKLPAIVADMGIIYLLYLFGKSLIGKKAGLISAFAFAFSPPFWYSSAFWGQTDSIYALFLLGAFYAIHKERFILAPILYGLSLLTKPTGLFVLPVFIFFWLKKANPSIFIKSIIALFIEVVILYFPFHPQKIIPWIVGFYQRSLGGELSYMVANSFNFWALIFGFDNRPDTTPFLGIPTFVVGYAVFGLIALAIVWYIWKRKGMSTQKVLLLGVLISFAAFLFLPRMHERYFYPVLLLMTPLLGLNKKLAVAFWALSAIHLVNLYHFWWVPRVNFLISLFSNHLVERFFIIMNIGIFVWLLVIFKKQYVKES